jgi:hypothetical protein
MKNVYVCMSGTRYHDTTKKIVDDAPKFGADEVLVYDDVWLRSQTDYMLKAKWLLEHPRGRAMGWFAWKPFLILDALERVSDDDVVLYTDADTYPIADLKVLFDIGRRDGIMLFAASGWPHQRVWCKRACFRMMGQDEPKYHEAHHGCARFMCFTRRHKAFLEEWYYYCLQPRGQTFDLDPNDGPELPGFREHRTEQAIMTNLAHKYGHKLYREACEFGMPPNYTGTEDRELYGQLFTQVYGQSPGDPNSGSQFRNV